MVLRLDGGPDGIKHLSGHLLALWGNGTTVDEGLESLPAFALEHHFELPPAGLVVISFFVIDVKGLQVVDHSCMNTLQSSNC